MKIINIDYAKHTYNYNTAKKHIKHIDVNVPNTGGGSENQFTKLGTNISNNF